MADVATIFLAVAAVTFVGFAAGHLFERTRFPDVAILLVLGLMLGPLNRILVENGRGLASLADALDPSNLAAITPLISGLALVVILFDAGLRLDFSHFKSSIGPAFLITLPVMALTSLAIGAVGYFVYGMHAIVAAVLGVALSNVGQTVSASVMQRMSLPEPVRVLGFLEMALYDVLSIPILVSLFELASGSGGAAGLQESLRGFAQVISVSLLLGGTAGALWIVALRRLHGHPNSYMLTLAVLLLVYALSKILDGAGALSILLFGLVVGNRAAILKRFTGSTGMADAELKVQNFHEETTFFVRTVFFLFLGLSFTMAIDGEWPVASPWGVFDSLANKASLFILGAALVIVAIPLVRAAYFPLVSMREPGRLGLIPVFGHGLGTAVLATLPFVWPDYVEGTVFYERFSPWQPVFLNLAFLVILFSVLGSALLVFVHERGVARQANAAKKASKAGKAE
jgi:potassium/hydrogen antiporter